MAVAYNTATSAAFEGVTSASVNHTAAGADRLAVAHVSSAPDTSTISSITYGGNAMASIATVVQATFELRASMYRYVAPATSSQSCQVNFSAAAYGAIGVTSYTGADQTTPISNSNTGQGNNGLPSVTVTSAADEMVTDCLCFFNSSTGVATAGAGQTERYETRDSFGDTGAASTEAGASSVSMTWTFSSTTIYWALVAASIKAVSGGGGNTYDNSFSLGATGNLSYARTLDMPASMSMGAQGGVVSSTLASLLSTLSLSSQPGVALSGLADLLASVVFQSTMDGQYQRGLDTQAALAAGVQASTSAQAAITVTLAMLMSHQVGVTTTPDVVISSLMGLQSSLSLGVQSTADLVASLNSAVQTAIQFGLGNTFTVDFTLGANGTITVSSIAALVGAITAASTVGMQSTATANLLASITPGVLAGILMSEGGGPVFNEALALSTSAGMDLAAQAIFESALALAQSLNLSHLSLLDAVADAGFSTVLQTALSRTLTMDVVLALSQATGISISDIIPVLVGKIIATLQAQAQVQAALATATVIMAEVVDTTNITATLEED